MSPGAFGLEIVSESGLPGLTAPGGVAAARLAEHRVVGREALAPWLAQEPLRTIGRDGKGALRVEYLQGSSGAVLVRTRSFGDHLIADGGRAILSVVAGVDRELWQRYVLGQVLPLTASLQGLEIFHASAVAIGGAVVVLAGPSGAGKSSLAAALIGIGGARFFADDVLALDPTPFELVGYPGPALINVPRERLASLPPGLLAGPAWSDADPGKVLLPVRGERRALPILAFFRLSPDEEQSGVRFEPCLPDRLMATTFDGVSRTPARQLRLLRVGAMLAAQARAEEVRYRSGADPEAVATALLERLRGAGAGTG